MSKPLVNKGLQLARLQNQRRIAFSLIERSRTLLKPGTSFTRELHELFRSQGKFGSKDRRLYRELIFTYLRFLPWLDDQIKDQEAFTNTLLLLAAPTPEIRSLYPTLPHTLDSRTSETQRFKILEREAHQLVELLPHWFAEHTNRSVSIPALLSLITRPPLWLRVQNDPQDNILELLKKTAKLDQAEQIARHPLIPDCIHAPADYALANHPAYLEGMVEIQDISSQILLNLLREKPTGHWLDACAGAGGKTLQLANLLKPYGKVDAFDPRSSALRELQSRTKRSGLRNIKVLHKRPTHGNYRGVLVDAPCSGTGTWRRHPYLMRQTREEDIFEHAKSQLGILKSYSTLVANDGILVYSTCSLSRHENEAVTERFLATEKQFRYEPLSPRFGLQDRGQGITVHPEDHNGDGLYVATFRKHA